MDEAYSKALYDIIRDIVMRYDVKCRKYKAEELTIKMKEILFDEAYKEFCFMEGINNKLIGGAENGR